MSRQTISAFVKCSNNELTDLKTAVKEHKCKRVLKMEHFEYIDNEIAKNDELCAVGKNISLFLSDCQYETRQVSRDSRERFRIPATF